MKQLFGVLGFSAGTPGNPVPAHTAVALKSNSYEGSWYPAITKGAPCCSLKPVG